MCFLLTILLHLTLGARGPDDRFLWSLVAFAAFSLSLLSCTNWVFKFKNWSARTFVLSFSQQKVQSFSSLLFFPSLPPLCPSSVPSFSIGPCPWSASLCRLAYFLGPRSYSSLSIAILWVLLSHSWVLASSPFTLTLVFHFAHRHSFRLFFAVLCSSFWALFFIRYYGFPFFPLWLLLL